MSTTTKSPDWARFAPSLAHLLPQLLEHDAVLAGYSSGPQPGYSGYAPGCPESFAVLVENPWGEEQWVLIRADGCEYCDAEGDLFSLSHAEFWQYLRQLPRPLYSFCRPIN